MIRDTWAGLGKTWQWVTGVATGTASLIAAYFAMVGFMGAVDGWVVTEAEAAEQMQQQIEVFEEYRKGLADERTTREMNDLQIDIGRLDLQIRYLNNLASPSADEVLEKTSLIEYRATLQKRLRYLRCIVSGRPSDECSV